MKVSPVQPTLSLDDLIYIIADISYKGWQFNVAPLGDGFYIQATFFAADNDKLAALPVFQKCRKWYISRFATKSEVLTTVLLAVQRAELHESEEQFLYKGVRIFGPHANVEALVEYTKTVKPDVRIPL